MVSKKRWSLPRYESDRWRISTGSDSGTKASLAQKAPKSSLERKLEHSYTRILPIPSFINSNYEIRILYPVYSLLGFYSPQIIDCRIPPSHFIASLPILHQALHRQWSSYLESADCKRQSPRADSAFRSVLNDHILEPPANYRYFWW